MAVGQTEITLVFPSKWGQSAREELRGKEIPARILQYEQENALREVTNIPLTADRVVGGATLTQGVGQWFEVSENVVLISTIIDNEFAAKVYGEFRALALAIKKRLYQDAVLIKAQAITADFV